MLDLVSFYASLTSPPASKNDEQVLDIDHAIYVDVGSTQCARSPRTEDHQWEEPCEVQGLVWATTRALKAMRTADGRELSIFFDSDKIGVGVVEPPRPQGTLPRVPWTSSQGG